MRVRPGAPVMTELHERVLRLVEKPADRLVAQFFDTAGLFAATTFDLLPDNLPDRFTTTDLLAVTLLDVALPPPAIRRLLESEASAFNGLLSAVAVEVDLWDASEDDLAKAEKLYWALRDLPKVGRARASKLMARKRPRLIPVVDSVILDARWLWETSPGGSCGLASTTPRSETPSKLPVQITHQPSRFPHYDCSMLRFGCSAVNRGMPRQRGKLRNQRLTIQSVICHRMFKRAVETPPFRTGA